MAELQAQSAALTRAHPGRAGVGAALADLHEPEPHALRGGFIWPVHGVVTSGFGWRWGRMHEGIDIAVGTGTPVVAAASGTVIVAGWLGGYGNLVVVDHGGGIATAYGHNTSVAVGVGQYVAQGQVIAYSGTTGHSTGPHVHFEVRVNGPGRPARLPLPVPGVALYGTVADLAGSRRATRPGCRRSRRRRSAAPGQRAPALVEPEAVAGEELVRHGEADVARAGFVDEPPVGPVEQRHRREARPACGAPACARGSSTSAPCRRRPRRPATSRPTIAVSRSLTTRTPPVPPPV